MAEQTKQAGEGGHQDDAAGQPGATETGSTGTGTGTGTGTDQKAETAKPEPESGAAGSTRTEAKESKESRRAEKKRERGERAADKPKGEAVATIRSRVAQLVWLLCVVAALFLAVGALCVALGANKNNDAVSFILNGAMFFDLDIFSRRNGIKTFGGDSAATKNALFNWGIAAVVYLIVGRILERIIRP